MIKKHKYKILVGLVAIVLGCVLPILAIDFAYDNGFLCFVSPGLCRVDVRVATIPTRIPVTPNPTLPSRTLAATPSQWPTPTTTPEEETPLVEISVTQYFVRIIREEDCGRDVYKYNDVANQFERRFSPYCDPEDPYEWIFEGLFWDNANQLMNLLEVDSLTDLEELGLWNSACHCVPAEGDLNLALAQKLTETVTPAPTPKEDDSKDV